MRKKHICKDCKRGDPDVMFYRRGNGFRFVCKECDKKRRTRYTYSSEAKKRRNQHRNMRQAADRKLPELAARYILMDTRQTDKRKGMTNDLTLQFIEVMIESGCSYCGDHESRISLDRIDNSIGHIQSNVNPCCRRCNLLRRDMPYEAWINFIPVVRTVASQGLFGSWNAGPLKSFTMPA
jgi:hypothetical protein